MRTLLELRNDQVIHNVHIFSKYQRNIWELAYLSNARIAEKEFESLDISELSDIIETVESVEESV